jgi:flagellar assembly protein FliH
MPDAVAAHLQARLAEVEQEARQREQVAYESGLREGRTVGAEEAAERLEPVLERLSRSVEEILGQRRRFRREAEEDVVKLALAIGRRVLHRELSVDPEALLGVVKAALRRIEMREINRLRVHPHDVPLVRKHFEQAGRLERIEVHGDPALERGAVLFDTARGHLDASVETQLQEIQRGLSDLIQGRS